MERYQKIYLPILVFFNIFPDSTLKLLQVFISRSISQVSSPLHWLSQNFWDIHEKKYLFCIDILQLSLSVSLLVLRVFEYPVESSPDIFLVELMSSHQFLVREAASPTQVLPVLARPPETVGTITGCWGASSWQTLVDSLGCNQSFREQIWSRVDS